ncbi:Alfin [Theobroma cacao]|nr:Alfin [Theobroma cacao]
MDGGTQYNLRTVEEVFRDFKGRRAGMIKALTTDVGEFYEQCDPGLFLVQMGGNIDVWWTAYIIDFALTVSIGGRKIFGSHVPNGDGRFVGVSHEYDIIHYMTAEVKAVVDM